MRRIWNTFQSYQIWVYPKQKDVLPKYDQFKFCQEDKQNKILLVISPDKQNKTAGINQDAFFSLLELEQNKSLTYIMHKMNHGVYIHVVTGKVSIENNELISGDAIGIYEIESVRIDATENANLIFVEVPMERGIKLS